MALSKRSMPCALLTLWLVSSATATSTVSGSRQLRQNRLPIDYVDDIYHCTDPFLYNDDEEYCDPDTFLWDLSLLEEDEQPEFCQEDMIFTGSTTGLPDALELCFWWATLYGNLAPTASPTVQETAASTTLSPTMKPSTSPSVSPSSAPTPVPTSSPSTSPSTIPTRPATPSPTTSPPTPSPPTTETETLSPSEQVVASSVPSQAPSQTPAPPEPVPREFTPLILTFSVAPSLRRRFLLFNADELHRLTRQHVLTELALYTSVQETSLALLPYESSVWPDGSWTSIQELWGTITLQDSTIPQTALDGWMQAAFDQDAMTRYVQLLQTANDPLLQRTTDVQVGQRMVGNTPTLSPLQEEDDSLDWSDPTLWFIVLGMICGIAAMGLVLFWIYVTRRSRHQEATIQPKSTQPSPTDSMQDDDEAQADVQSIGTSNYSYVEESEEEVSTAPSFLYSIHEGDLGDGSVIADASIVHGRQRQQDEDDDSRMETWTLADEDDGNVSAIVHQVLRDTEHQTKKKQQQQHVPSILSFSKDSQQPKVPPRQESSFDDLWDETTQRGDDVSSSFVGPKDEDESMLQPHEDSLELPEMAKNDHADDLIAKYYGMAQTQQDASVDMSYLLSEPDVSRLSLEDEPEEMKRDFSFLKNDHTLTAPVVSNDEEEELSIIEPDEDEPVPVLNAVSQTDSRSKNASARNSSVEDDDGGSSVSSKSSWMSRRDMMDSDVPESLLDTTNNTSPQPLVVVVSTTSSSDSSSPNEPTDNEESSGRRLYKRLSSAGSTSFSKSSKQSAKETNDGSLSSSKRQSAASQASLSRHSSKSLRTASEKSSSSSSANFSEASSSRRSYQQLLSDGGGSQRSRSSSGLPKSSNSSLSSRHSNKAPPTSNPPSVLLDSASIKSVPLDEPPLERSPSNIPQELSPDMFVEPHKMMPLGRFAIAERPDNDQAAPFLVKAYRRQMDDESGTREYWGDDSSMGSDALHTSASF